MRYVLKTLGCKANLSDSQLIEAELRKRGWEPGEGKPGESGASLCIVNSCTVTDEAERQSRKLAAKLSREHPGARIVFTGCGAEVAPESAAASHGVHYVVGNQDKPKLVEEVLSRLDLPAPSPGRGEILGQVRGYAELLSRHPMDREWADGASLFQAPPGLHRGQAGRKRTFLKIQEGCNSFCTYCIIPYGRGPARSLAPETILEQIRGLVGEGVVEVVLTGTNLGDYGAEGGRGRGLDALIKRIVRETELPRLRLSSLDPTEITDELLSFMESETRLCGHFHVSLQSPHDRLLRAMKRKYGSREAESCLRAISRLRAGRPGGVFVGMDLITGFPGESREEFEWSENFLARLPWSRLHVFPYSERDGTPATRLSAPVPSEERARRASVLRRMSLDRLAERHRRILDSVRSGGAALGEALLESPCKGPSGENGWWSGYTENYLRVLVPGQGEELTNRRVRVAPEEVLVDKAAGDAAFRARILASS